MRALALVMAAILLSSCIEVEDFGDYWKKGVIDHQLAGRWQKMDGTPGDKPLNADSPEEWTFTLKGDAYDLQSYRDGKAGDEPVRAKTLKLGNYTFVMIGPKHGELFRYTLEGGILRGFELNADRVREKFPLAANLAKSGGKDLGVKRLDDDIADILGHLSEDYWTQVAQYRRVL